ncbi:hypothetical protein DV515_00004265 [Chloebia gouldiae]|uniref:Toll-like receptor 2 n=1 Tax=Chloebia gouldiae TaxID=44316 RepID=A0A3L8SRG5_CHLGU|nr:hypothetical protein DV515_00004265 [Chloebia gouldiae]
MRILPGCLHFYFIPFLLSGAHGFLIRRTPPAFLVYNYSYSNLSSVSEAQAPKTARALNFSHNAIEKITKGDLEGFDWLEFLDFSYNQIRAVEPGVFQSLLSLVSVDLSHNDEKLLLSDLPPHLKLSPAGKALRSLQLSGRSSGAALQPSASAEEPSHSGVLSLLQILSPRLRRSTGNLLRRGERNITALPTATPEPTLCGTPINGTLNLSHSNLTQDELVLKLDEDLCQAQLRRILELDISHNNVEMDLLSLFSLFFPMENTLSIDASSNKLTINILNPESFCNFPSHQLLFLNISNNPINSLDRLCLPSSIKEIDLSFTNISQIPLDFAKKLFNLEKMYVQGNHFIYTVFSESGNTLPTCVPPPGTVHLNALSLVRNTAGTPIESLPEKVKHLGMSNCSIVELPEWFADTVEELLFLDLSSNHISVLPNFPPSLQHLDISSNDIKVISSSLKSLSNLKIFRIQNNKIMSIHTEFFPSALKKCDFSKNKVKVLSLTSALENLEHLNISGNLITRLEPAGHLPALTSLDSSHNLIPELPDGFGESLPGLKYFNLSGNKISFLQRGSLPVSLVELDISDNAITTIVEATFGPLTSLRLLTVQGDHFFCTCDLYWFVNVYLHEPQLEIRGREAMRCSFPSERRGSPVGSSRLTLLRCSLGVQLAVTAGAASLAMLALTALCWRLDGPWYIRMGWYWCMAKRKQYEKRPENKLFDAFISYSEHDADWTKENLLKTLENDGFRICYHERDFKPGHPVLGNIFYCIENSHKVLFVLSPSFVNSCWCQYELYFAEHRVLNENLDSLIMIVLEDLPSHSVPQKFSKLRKLLRRKTYLKWSPEEHKQKMFWHQLKAVLKTTNEPLVRAENGSALEMQELE